MQRTKNFKVKIFGAILAIALLSSVFGYSLALRTATTNYILDTPLPTGAYYVGQYSNSSYFAINGSTWNNFLISTNASLIIQTCIDNLTPGRSTPETVILSGNFSKSVPINVPAYTNLVGYSAVIKNNAGLPVGDTEILDVTGDYVTISDLTLDGNAANNLGATGGTGQGVNVWIRASHVTVVNVVSMNARVNGFEAWGYSATPLTDIWFMNCRSIDDSYNGIGFAHNVTQSGAVGCYVHGTGDIALFASGTASNSAPKYIEFLNCVVDTLDGTLGSSNAHYGCRFEFASFCSIKGGSMKGVKTGVLDDPWGSGHHVVDGVRIETLAVDWESAIQFQQNNSLVTNCYLIIQTNQIGIRFLGNYTQALSNFITDQPGASGTTALYEDASGNYNTYAFNRLFTASNATLNGAGQIVQFNQG